MATSVKMRDEDKRRLDRLQGEVVARGGRRISQQDLLARLLDIAESEKERLLQDTSPPMTKREIAVMRRLCVHTGIATREEDIDRIVAGEAK